MTRSFILCEEEPTYGSISAYLLMLLFTQYKTNPVATGGFGGLSPQNKAPRTL